MNKLFFLFSIFLLASFIYKMPSEVKEFFTAANSLTPKAACIEFA